MPNRLKELRNSKGLSMKQMSTELVEKKYFDSITDATLSNYENEKREPKLETWVKLADYFGVDVGYLQGTVSEEHEAESLINDFEKVYLSKAQETLSQIENARLRVSKLSVNNENHEEINHIVKELNTLEDNLKKDVHTLKEKGAEQFFKDKNLKSIQAQNKKASDDKPETEG